ncbi:hypothetical protein JMN32_18370 [Fulvivirga sp. 29W222]|uniref:Uncharacterized protein n=1 Tax=Fulvivirga marina TaxID=2494733 RepID=A0A937G4H8_9BACT|nr:hypothetical protein [Fulvivirga marina]MBL6448286.1 hypothetical protein [Fulvivirga marina]
MVTFPHVLEERIQKHNELYNTDFKIIETIYDDVPFCVIEMSGNDLSQIFDLGYGLAILENVKKEQGKLDW